MQLSRAKKDPALNLPEIGCVDSAKLREILLQGNWLEQAEFSAGDKITVKCQQGQPIITKD